MYPKDHSWDEFLIRFYKPTADACARVPPKCEVSVEKIVGERVIISGAGSSDGDPYNSHIFQAFWNIETTVSTRSRAVYVSMSNVETQNN